MLICHCRGLKFLIFIILPRKLPHGSFDALVFFISSRGAVYNKLSELHEKYACSEYLHAMSLMKRYCGYSSTRIPQAHDISEFLQVTLTDSSLETYS